MGLLSKLTKDYEEYLLRLIFGREISLSRCGWAAGLCDSVVNRFSGQLYFRK